MNVKMFNTKLSDKLPKGVTDLLIIGNPKAERKVWLQPVNASRRKHGEWFMEGLIYRLCDEQDAVSINLLKTMYSI